MSDFLIEDGVLKQYLGGSVRVTVPEGVTEIAEHAFAMRGSILEVSLPKSLSRLGAETFHFCESLHRVTFSGGGVREIPDGCFRQCRALESVTLPPRLRRIGKEAFRSCRNLRHVCFPETLEEIGDAAFYLCESLVEASLPEGLLRIGAQAFIACEELKSLHLPTSLSSIGVEAFAETPSLASVTLPAGWRHAPQLISRRVFDRPLLWHALLSDAVVARSVAKFIKREKQEILEYSTAQSDVSLMLSFLNVWRRVPLEILEEMLEAVKNSPEHVAVLMEYRHRHYGTVELERRGAMRLELEDEPDEGSWEALRARFRFSVKDGEITLKELLGEADEVLLPTEIGGKRVTRVLPSLFSTAFGGISFSVREDNAHFLTRNGSLLSRDGRVLYAYFDTGEAEPEIPAGVCEIGERAFWGVRGITSVTLPASVTLVGKEAFRGCPRLERVTALGQAVGIGEAAFKECSALREMDACDLSFIGASAFSGCFSLKSVSVLRSLTSVGESAFLLCRGIETLTLPACVEEIGDYAFRGCSELSAVELPKRLVSLGKSAFEECSSLRRISIPERLRVLRQGVFRACGSLAQVNLYRGLEIIEARAFYGCASLRELRLPATLVRLGEGAFSGSAIECLRFAGGSVFMESFSLSGCARTLREIYWNGSRASWRYAYRRENGWGTMATVHCRDGEIQDRPFFKDDEALPKQSEDDAWWEEYDDLDI